MFKKILSYTGTPDSIEIQCQDDNNTPYTLKFKTGKLEVLLSSEQFPVYGNKNGEEQYHWFKNQDDFYIKIPIIIEDEAVCTITNNGGKDGRKRTEGKSRYIR